MSPDITHTPIEHHYTIEEVAGFLRLSKDTCRRLFQHEPGVFVMKSRPKKYRRAYTTIRIPESVLVRVHRRMTLIAA